MAEILVTVLVFGMMIVGCDEGNGGDNGGGSGFIGATLNLSGQVWISDWDENDERIVERYTGGNRTVTSHLGGNGSITNGQLSFSIGTPSGLESIQEIIWWGEEFELTNFNISPSNARIAELDILDVSGNGGLYKIGENNSGTISEDVFYYYVDRDVTITGTGGTHTWEHGCDCNEWNDRCYCGGSGTFTVRNINLSFKAGWNAVTLKSEWNERTDTETYSIIAGDSSIARWFLYEDDGYSMNIQGFTENVIPNNNNAKSLLRLKH